MGAESKIEWTDATWPVVKGCDYVSAGCANCYAVDLIHRHAANPNEKISLPLAGLTEKRGERTRWTGKVYLNEPHLRDPLSWKKGRMIFVPSHGDLFHEDVPDAFIDRVFAIMAMASHHTFQVLTKRSERARTYLSGAALAQRIWTLANSFGPDRGFGQHGDDPAWIASHVDRWPLPNVWLGVSVENQAAADERIPHLLRTPAAVRFLSCEPLLGPVRLRDVNQLGIGPWKDEPDLGLNWVIVGGESGPNARPMHPDWARSLRDQCQAAGVPFFFKQWGEFIHAHPKELHLSPGPLVEMDDGPTGKIVLQRVGKKAAGRLLDGRLWDEFPVVAQ